MVNIIWREEDHLLSVRYINYFIVKEYCEGNIEILPKLGVYVENMLKLSKLKAFELVL